MQQNQTPTLSDTSKIDLSDSVFISFNDAVRARASKVIVEADGVLFKVNLKNKNKLFEEYLAAFEEQERQASNCNCCKSFLRTYGGLVAVDLETGVTKSVMWDETTVPEKYAKGVKIMREIVEKSLIREVFYKESTNMNTLGMYRKGGYEHFSILSTGIQEPYLKTSTGAHASLVSPAKYKTLKTHLGLFTPAILKQAVALFEHDARLKNEDKHYKMLAWFTEFKERIAGFDFKSVDNLIWHAVATQSEGKLKFGNTAIGTFVENIQKGMLVPIAIDAFKEAVKSENYMRAKAAPTVGNISHAEKLIEELDLASALKRRFMRVEEIPSFVWKPTKEAVKEKAKEGVFGHLEPKDSVATSTELPEIAGGTITWDRFVTEVLPKAKKIMMEFNISNRYNLGTYVTAIDPTAKPLIKWDSEEVRNPASHYVHTNGAYPKTWNIEPKGYAAKVYKEVIAISHLCEDFTKEDKSKSCALIIEGARETVKAGLALFANNLRPELFPIRSTIEQFSNKGELEGMDESFGAVFIVDAVYGLGLNLMVTTDNAIVKYMVDRTR